MSFAKNSWILVFLISFSITFPFSGCAAQETPNNLSKVPAAPLDSLALPSDSLKAKIEKSRIEEMRKAEEVSKEAQAAYEETLAALQSLYQDSTQAAIASLERATGKLDVLLARHSEAGMLPVDVNIDVIDLETDLNGVKRMRKEIESLIDDGNLPAARTLLDELTSEIRITTVYLPLSTYPFAILESARLLDQGNKLEASILMQEALTSFVESERVIPIPIINAEALVEAASKESDKKLKLALLTDARTQLQLAQTLGYAASNHAYKDLERDLKQVEAAVKADEVKDAMFHEITDRLRKFREEISGS